MLDGTVAKLYGLTSTDQQALPDTLTINAPYASARDRGLARITEEQAQAFITCLEKELAGAFGAGGHRILDTDSGTSTCVGADLGIWGTSRGAQPIMRGLMTGRGAAIGRPCDIPVSLVVVVQNALAHAWRRLLEEVADGNFAICGEEENTITERSYMILDDLYSNEPATVQGLSVFQTPVREGNLGNRAGNKRNCQPDLTFCPLRGQLETRSSAMATIFVECKPTDCPAPSLAEARETLRNH